MAPNRFIVVVLILVSTFNCVTSQSQTSKLEGLTPCKNDDDCDNFKNATCLEGFCQCEGQPQYVCEDNSYVMTNRIEGQCEETSNCILNNSVCNHEKRCVCDQGFVASGDGRKCLEVTSKLRDSCEDDIQCSTKLPSSICQNHACICNNGTLERNGTCMRSLGLEEECHQDEECVTASSSCKNSKCACLETHVAINSKCLQIAQNIEDGCEEDIQCSVAFGDGSHCSQDICQCKDLYQFKTVNSTCVRDIYLGEMCGTDSDCYGTEKEISRLRCVKGICKCKSGFKEVEGFCSLDGTQSSSTTTILRQPLFTLFLFVIVVYFVIN